MPLTPGQLVDGKYKVVRLVAEGGMGAIWEAEHTRIKRKIAIKVLLWNMANDAECIGRFDREARVASLVSTPYVADVIDLGDLPSGERFIVMEYLDGETLQTRL